MQRSDIANINKLFLESTSTYYVYVAEQNDSYSMFCCTNAYEVHTTDLKEAISHVAVNTSDVTSIYVSKSKQIGVVMATDGDICIVVSPYKQQERYIHDTFLDICSSPHFKSYDPEEFLASYKAKKAALHGSNDEAGLGDILDIV